MTYRVSVTQPNGSIKIYHHVDEVFLDGNVSPFSYGFGCATTPENKTKSTLNVDLRSTKALLIEEYDAAFGADRPVGSDTQVDGELLDLLENVADWWRHHGPSVG